MVVVTVTNCWSNARTISPQVTERDFPFLSTNRVIHLEWAFNRILNVSSEDFHHLVGILSVATPILSVAKPLQVIAIHASLVHICKWLNLNNSNFEMIVDGTYCWRARSQPCWNLRFHILSRPGFRSDSLKQFLGYFLIPTMKPQLFSHNCDVFELFTLALSQPRMELLFYSDKRIVSDSVKNYPNVKKENYFLWWFVKTIQ